MSSVRAEPLVFHPLPAGVNRRQAMTLMAASLALAGGACTRPPRERIHAWVDMPEARGGGLPLYYASAVLREGHAQGVLVGTQEGRPIKIEGNPLHPSSLGGTDVFAQASVLELWDPDRSSAVQQRLGPAREGEAEAPAAPSSWDAFEAAWRSVATRLQARAGEGLHVLTGPLTSPGLRAQIQDLRHRFARACWYQHAPLHDAAARAGAIEAFGQPVDTVRHFERARCIVALAADPFSDGPGAVRQAADWSHQRTASRATGGLARCFAVEVGPGLFGARADHRIALAPPQIDDLVERLAAHLLGGAAPAAAGAAATTSSGTTTDSGPVLRDRLARFEADLAQALRDAGPAALLVPGAALSARSHALVHALHAELGALGRTHTLLAPLAMAPDAGSLADLVSALDAGAVDTLLILDANPVYDAPGVLGFARALEKARLSIHSGLYRDETARRCDWHLPLSHTLEQWSDGLAHDGTATLVQPAIAPLYDSRSLHELLALLAGTDERNAHRLLQRQWQARWHMAPGHDFEARWREALQSGVIDGSAPPALALRARRPAAAAPSSALPRGSLTAVFAPDPSAHDGRHANNAWLQELPRPFTKLTWHNALLLGPATAQTLGVATGDVVRASVEDRHVDAPVWVLAGHAEGAATLPLGQGRRAAGRIGDGIGFDAYVLRGGDAAPAPLRLQPLGRRIHFAVSQHAIEQEGRALARTLRAGQAFAEEAPPPSLYPAVQSPTHAWAMAIDLDACIGCNACTVACQAENNIPVVGPEEVSRGREMHWIRVDRYETPWLAGGSIFQPVPCMHCEKAPCELVCPVGATMHDSEGLNVQVYNRCIGTRFCSNNCPYKVRRFNFLQYADDRTETLKGQRNDEVTVRQRGVMEKCSYCVQRIARARQHAQATGVPLADGDVVTACQAACPTRAIVFGDLNDAHSAVRAARRSPRHYALLGELGTLPRTTYLARLVRGDDA